MVGIPASAEAQAALDGLAYSRLNVDLRQATPHEDNLEWRNKLFVSLTGDTDARTRAVFSLLAEHRTLSGMNTRYDFELNLYEGYVRFRRDRLRRRRCEHRRRNDPREQGRKQHTQKSA